MIQKYFLFLKLLAYDIIIKDTQMLCAIIYKNITRLSSSNSHTSPFMSSFLHLTTYTQAYTQWPHLKIRPPIGLGWDSINHIRRHKTHTHR
jgi:hypothetical protein